MPPGKQDLELYPKLWTVMTLLFGEGGCFPRASGYRGCQAIAST